MYKVLSVSKILPMLLLLAFSTISFALSPEAELGKASYTLCHSCHNPEANPALGPPMWGVQRRYNKNTDDKAAFITRMVTFVKSPKEENALQTQALKQMGLMPAMPLPDAMLKNIASYIYEEEFAPPCAHWKMAVEKAQDGGDLEHAKKDQRQLDRFCQ